MADSVLSADDVRNFHEEGFIVVREAFPHEAARAMQAEMWAKLEEDSSLRRDDPATWRDDGYRVNGLNKIANRPVFKGIASPRLCGSVNDLLGAGAWDIPDSWGGFLITFPQGQPKDWDITAEGWHWDGNPNYHKDELNGLFIFTLFSDIGPKGGGTLIVPGSHRLINRFFDALPPQVNRNKQKPIKQEFFRSLPYFAELTNPDDAATNGDRIRRFMQETTDVNGVPCRVAEVTGEPGDAFLCHPSLLHTPSPNHAATPRFMRIKALNRRGLRYE